MYIHISILTWHFYILNIIEYLKLGNLSFSLLNQKLFNIYLNFDCYSFIYEKSIHVVCFNLWSGEITCLTNSQISNSGIFFPLLMLHQSERPLEGSVVGARISGGLAKLSAQQEHTTKRDK